jgi:hypothetical protein
MKMTTDVTPNPSGAAPTGADAASGSSASVSAPAAAEAAASGADQSTSPVATAETAAPTVDAAKSSDTVTESTPSLISSAEGKQKADATADAPKPSDTPAPAVETKTDAKAADSPKKEEPAKPDDPGKTEVKEEAATDPAKEATAIAPPALVSLEDIKLPEGLKLADEPSKAFLETLNKADLAPKDRAQGLIDLHIKEINRVAEEAAKHQRKVWDDTNNEWKDRTRKEFPNNLNTVLGRGKALIEEYAGANAPELFQFLDYTGAGNHPAVVRFFDNLAQKLNIFEDGMIAANPKSPNMKGPGQRGWYDKSLNASGS